MSSKEQHSITGLLYKRRGGFGKMLPNCWQYRYFQLTKDGVLCYFDSETPDAGMTELTARGKLDLREVAYELSTEPIEGAPNNNSIIISPAGEEKWKLCADSKEDQSVWLKMLENFMHPAAKTSRSAIKRQPPIFTSDDEEDLNSSRKPTITVAISKSASLDDRANNHGINTTISPKAIQAVQKSSKKGRKGLKLAEKKSMFSQELLEVIIVLLISNICIMGLLTTTEYWKFLVYLITINIVIFHTLKLREERVKKVETESSKQLALAQAEIELAASKSSVVSPRSSSLSVSGLFSDIPATTPRNTINGANATARNPTIVEETVPHSVPELSNGLKIPGFTLNEVKQEPKFAPAHSWCQADPRQFNVRIGPEYNRYKKKAPSAPALYEAFAVDVFCTKLRVDHVATKFQLPDCSHLNTHNQYVPQIMILQIQIPSEPPASIFSSAQDGPGWAIVMYYRITEDTCKQLANLSTASPAVKLFAQWCEKAPVDPLWRGRFKVINSCSNLEQLGMPSPIVAYNAKPVLIRKTGTLFRGHCPHPQNDKIKTHYLEMDIHVHKFANMAKQSIYLISSRCGAMLMQIGFVVEGREDHELPETLFACVAVNKPQEDEASFIFDEEDDDDA